VQSAVASSKQKEQGWQKASLLWPIQQQAIEQIQPDFQEKYQGCMPKPYTATVAYLATPKHSRHKVVAQSAQVPYNASSKLDLRSTTEME
jgi:hypothetical protein